MVMPPPIFIQASPMSTTIKYHYVCFALMLYFFTFSYTFASSKISQTSLKVFKLLQGVKTYIRVSFGVSCTYICMLKRITNTINVKSISIFPCIFLCTIFVFFNCSHRRITDNKPFKVWNS